jgi:peptidoglycan/LPS O-acetylase OafA/YrhL
VNGYESQQAVTTEERLEKSERELSTAKYDKRLLVLVSVLLVGAALVLAMVWGTTLREGVLIAGLIVAAGSACIVILGCIPAPTRLLSLGIVLLGVAMAVAGWVFAMGYSESPSHWQFRPDDAITVAVCGFVIAVTGLSGLVCAALGLARLLAGRKGS